MDKAGIAAILEEMGTLLEIQGENPFRCNAYHNAARSLEQLEEDLGEVIASGRLKKVRGIGDTMAQKIATLHETGQLEAYEELKVAVGPGLVEMLRIQGLGPKKVKALHDALGIKTLDELKQACEDDHVAGLKGFGAKTQTKILEGLAFLATTGKRFLLAEAEPLGRRLLEQVQAHPAVLRAELCGSLRRRKETIGDLDILVSTSAPEVIMDLFVSLPEVTQVLAKGDTKSSILVQKGLQCDLRVVSDDHFPFALHYFTGSKDHNIAMRARAQAHGLKLNEYALEGVGRSVPCKDETDIFKALGLTYIPPELREMTGEMVASENDRLPTLVERADLRGTFHCHTTYSDGRSTLEEMARAARDLGLSYFGIGDHSQSLSVANGLSPERVREQHREIDQLNKKLKPFRILKGTECDIMPDGSLDFDDEVLASFDYVVASVHTHFNMTEEEMTNRLLRAVQHPRVTILGHATGRLLLRREGYKVNLDKVLKACVEHGVLVEINGQPERLDVDWIHCKRARSLGATFVINPDAHAAKDINYLEYGIAVARRGWLEKGDIFNTRSLKEVEQFLASRRDRC